MGMDLHQLLRSLCFNADWKYAVFWKPQHRARMVLTLEDAYYDNHEYYWPMEKQYSGKTLAQLHGGNFSNDLLGLAVTKMSYRVYSLGEGIVGQVAVTGEYQWISANDHVINSSSSSEFSDGWQCQFYAGIKTVVVIGIIPLGVIQLGSLHNVMENMDVVSYIRNLFLPLQDYSIIQIPNPMHSSMRSSMSASDIPIKNLGLENFPDRFQVMEKGGNIETPGFCSPFPSPKVKYMPSGFDGSDVGWHDKYGELYGDDNSNLLQSTSNMMQLDNQKYVNFSLLKEEKCRWENNGHNDMGMLPEKNQSSLLDNITFDNSNLSELISLPEKVVIDPTCSSEAILAVNSENSQCGLGTNLKEIMYCPGNSAANSRNSVKKFECEAKASNRTTSCSSLNFPAGCELREALGPAFVRRWNYFDSEGKETQNAELPEMADGSSTSQLTCESCSSNLLEAIVANICHNINDIKSEISSSTSIQSPLTSGKTPEGCSHNNLHMLDSESCSLDKRSLSKENTQCCLRELASAAESGWDFSTRWMRSPPNITTLATTSILPVDLNAVILSMELNIAFFAKVTGVNETADRFSKYSEARVKAINSVFWNEEMSQWLDYWLVNSSCKEPEVWRAEQQNQNVFASNFIPLWLKPFYSDTSTVERALESLKISGLVCDAGIATSLTNSSQQWDYPNGWAPLQHMIVEGLSKCGSVDARSMAEDIAVRWIRSNYVAYKKTGAMHEKYDVARCGEYGGGGEYTPQTGFGWTNGVVLALLEEFGWPLDRNITLD